MVVKSIPNRSSAALADTSSTHVAGLYPSLILGTPLICFMITEILAFPKMIILEPYSFNYNFFVTNYKLNVTECKCFLICLMNFDGLNQFLLIKLMLCLYKQRILLV